MDGQIGGIGPYLTYIVLGVNKIPVLFSHRHRAICILITEKSLYITQDRDHCQTSFAEWRFFLSLRFSSVFPPCRYRFFFMVSKIKPLISSAKEVYPSRLSEGGNISSGLSYRDRVWRRPE